MQVRRNKEKDRLNDKYMYAHITLQLYGLNMIESSHKLWSQEGKMAGAWKGSHCDTHTDPDLFLPIIIMEALV